MPYSRPPIDELDINKLHRRGALKEGAVTSLGGMPPADPAAPKSAALVAGDGVLYLGEQALAWEWQPIIARNPPPSWGERRWRARPKFICDCGAGAYVLHRAADGAFACGKCAGYRRPYYAARDAGDSYAGLLRRLARAQRALRMEGAEVLADLPPPPPGGPRAVWLYRRRALALRAVECRLLGINIEDFLRRAEPPAPPAGAGQGQASAAPAAREGAAKA